MSVKQCRSKYALWCGVVIAAGTAFVSVLCMGLLIGWRKSASQDLASVTFMVAIASDGDRVYYDTVVDGVPCIVTDSVRDWGTQRHLVITNGGNPFLSGDGCLLFFDRMRGGQSEIWIYDMRTQQERCVVSKQTDCSVHDVNGDGTQILVTTSSRGGGLGRFVRHLLVEVQSGQVSEMPDYGAAFVRDKGIVFSQQGQKGIWIKGHGGLIQKILPRGHFPSASPNGQRLLYVGELATSLKEWQWEVYDLAQDRVIPIGPAMNPSFSQDGKDVVYLDTALNGTAWNIDLETGHRTNLGRLPGYLSGWRTSPGGVGAVASGTVVVFDSKTTTVRQLPIAPWTKAVK